MANPSVNVDFKAKSDPTSTQFSPSMKWLLLKPSHSFGIVLHEIGHLLGLSHEHERPDVREEYYRLCAGSQGAEEEIKQSASRGVKLQTYGKHDIFSIMHYPESCYRDAEKPSAGDISAVKAVNGWN